MLPTDSIFLNVQKISKNYLPSILPSACNPVYRVSTNLCCPYCVGEKGRRRHYKTLWQFYQHCGYHHRNENYRELVLNLAELIIKGVIV